MQGLTSHEAEKRLHQFDLNTLPEKPPPSSFRIFLSQFMSPLVYVLFAAGAITLFLGDTQDAAVIFIAVLLNALFGFVQERKASQTLTSLKKLIVHEVEVLRDGKRQKLTATNLVPGDIVYLHQGTKVPADGVLLEANRLFVNEAILTGESLPVAKSLEEKKESIANIFMGTVIASGFGLMEVTVTGSKTEMGKIALEIQEPREETPLKQKLTTFSHQLVILVISLTFIVFIVGVVSQRDMLEMFTVSTALAVSAIPESLLIGLTVVLAIGMQRILKRNGLVRKLVSAETLGGVTTICLDKTGTLTKGKFEIAQVVGDTSAIALQMIVANDHDDPIVIAAYEWATSKESPDRFLSKYPRLDNIPFLSKERYSVSLTEWDSKNNMLFVNGAPDYLLEWSDLSAKEKASIMKTLEEFTLAGKRVVGLARKNVSKKITKIYTKVVKEHLTWVGMIAFTDPVRVGVADALSKAQKAGIKLIVITGDYPKTARSVMAEVGIDVAPHEIITGDVLQNISSSDFSEQIKDIKLFARTTPEQKLSIVEALKSRGEVVAMMGDGVNDAPALNRADIGIVVGDAADVAKESADLVLLDSRFETVVAAVEEGRGIYSNVRKIIMYLMSAAFNEITTVVGAIILGFPLPITTAQILWINLVSDGFPNIALTIDPKHKGLMQSPPRPPQELLVTPWMKALILIISLTSGILSLGLFVYVFMESGDLKKAQSVAFVSLGINSLIYVFSIRTLSQPFGKESFFANKWLIGAVFAGFVLQFTPFIFESTRQFFGVVMLPASYWISIFGTGIVTLVIIELVKSAYRFRFKNHITSSF